jgi:hypothetical protein
MRTGNPTYHNRRLALQLKEILNPLIHNVRFPPNHDIRIYGSTGQYFGRGDSTAATPTKHYPCGRITTLITPSSLSRNFLYISGASSSDAGCVTTKLGSMSPASIRASSGLV